MQPEITIVPLMQMASGDRLSLQTYCFQGATPGKKVYIQANLHGAELAGNAVVYALIEFFSQLDAAQLKGEVLLLPLCNPLGVNQRTHHFVSGRFNPYDGRDWNRIHWDYEKTGADIPAFAKAHLKDSPEQIIHAFRQQIGLAFQRELETLRSPAGVPIHQLYRTQLQALALDADYLVDLHSSTNEGLTYLYYFDRRADSARTFGLDFGTLLDQYDGDAFDEAFIKPWLALEMAFEQLHHPLRLDIEAFTLELGTGMQIDADAVKRGIAGVQNYLVHKGMLPSIEPPRVNESAVKFAHHSRVIKYYATAGGLVQQRLKPGTTVKKDQRLYQLLVYNKSGDLPQVVDTDAIADGLIFDVSTNHAVNQGEYVMAVVPFDESL
ncbi:MAG: succinylglutamate desuccinylase/aspartoacylase family protein [Cyanobacteria bacterium P01_A01_bin.123]